MPPGDHRSRQRDQDAQHRPRVNAHRCAHHHQRRHRGPQRYDGGRAVHTIRPGHARPRIQLFPAHTPIVAHSRVATAAAETTRKLTGAHIEQLSGPAWRGVVWDMSLPATTAKC
jgi:hypothetical protein